MGEREDRAAKPEKPDYLGHRQRLRQRLLEGGTEALPDYELLEFLLFSARPQGDTKPLAKALLKRFGSLGAVLSADADSLLAVDGMGKASAATLKATREAGLRLIREEVQDPPGLSPRKQLVDHRPAPVGS